MLEFVWWNKIIVDIRRSLITCTVSVIYAIIYVTHWMGKHAQEIYLGVIDTSAS